MQNLKKLILDKEAVISVVGLGYVGLPLAIEFAKKGFKVCGIDIDKRRLDSIKRGKSYILDISDADLTKAHKGGRFAVTDSYSRTGESHAVIICVPTPLRKTQDPDMSYILEAVSELKKHIRKNILIVLESTTYPGTTEEIILPMLAEKGFKAGKDFFLAFSPERIDPANAKYRTNNIPKVIGGLTLKCLDIAKTLYSEIVSEVVTVSSPRAAEMVKLLENSFRSVNIALANEVALICSKMGIDVWEVIKAAESKPFGFMPFYPGPGIGGHCIPADPMYLIWKSRLSGYEPKLIRTAHEINSAMPGYVVSRVVFELKSKSIPLSSSRVLIAGVAYKPDVNDIRESPALEIIHILSRKGARVEFYDPHVKELQIKGRKYKTIDLNKNNIAKYDAVVIITNHSSIDYGIFKKAKLVLDTRNALKWNAQNIVKI